MDCSFNTIPVNNQHDSDLRPQRHAPFDLKLVFVKLAGFGFALPTLSLVFWKSFFFSFFLRALDPITSTGW